MSKILEVKDIDISFGGVHALNKVSFSIEQGEILGLIGPNGSGKSTCVNIISGVYKANSGSVYFDGNLIKSNMSISKRALMGMGRTFQTPKPFGNLSVMENVLTIALLKNNRSEAINKTTEILAFTGLDQQKDLVSAKLPIEKRKWLDLARILATEPKLIMMDEVIAGLNQKEMADSFDLVKSINSKGISILFIEHVLKAVTTLCSRVVVLNDGNLLAEGEPMEVLQRREVIDAYIGGQRNARRA